MKTNLLTRARWLQDVVDLRKLDNDCSQGLTKDQKAALSEFEKKLREAVNTFLRKNCEKYNNVDCGQPFACSAVTIDWKNTRLLQLLLTHLDQPTNAQPYIIGKAKVSYTDKNGVRVENKLYFYTIYANDYRITDNGVVIGDMALPFSFTRNL